MWITEKFNALCQNDRKWEMNFQRFFATYLLCKTVCEPIFRFCNSKFFMQQSDAQQSTNLLSSSLYSNKSMKYNGLVHRSFYKQLRDVLVEYINYVYTVAPKFRMMHNVVSFFRILQLVGPSLCPADEAWKSNHTLDLTVSILSIFFHIIPPEARDGIITFFCIAYILVMLMIAGAFIGFAYYFNKAAKLPTVLSYFTVIFIGTANFLIHPIALDFAFEVLSKSIFRKINPINSTAAIVIPIFVFLVYSIYQWFFTVIISQTLIFRPISLATIMSGPQNMIFLATNIQNCLFGFAVYCPENIQFIIMIVATFIYIAVAFIPFYHGGFIQISHKTIVSSASLTGIIICLIFIATDILNQQLAFVYLIAVIIIFVILTVIMQLIFYRLHAKSLKFLDEYNEEVGLSNVRSVNKFLNIAIDGMSSAHPNCVNWSIFKEANDQWPHSADVLYIFAKFAAIYPEDTTTLSFVFRITVLSKIKGATARAIKEQTKTITRQREANLSPNLKIKLNSISKKLVSAKHKLRHVWDLAIQGSVNEMENGIKRAYHELERSDAEYKHLFREFPNNRFVTRNYARFCKELLANQTLYTEFIDKSRQLQRGIAVNKDQTHELGIDAFPALPTKVKVTIEQMASMSTEMSMSSMEETEEFENLDDSQTAELRMKIDKMSIPAIRTTRLMRSLMILILLIIPMVSLFIYSSIFIIDLTAPLSYFKEIAVLRNKIVTVAVFSYHYVYERLGVYNRVIPQAKLPYNLGGVWNSSKITMFAMSDATNAMQSMNDFNGYLTTNKNLLKAQDLMFGNTLNYSFFTNVTNRVDVNHTIQAGCVQIINEVSEIIEKEEIDGSIVNTSMILNPLNNMEEIADVLGETMNLMIDFIRDNYEKTQKISQIMMIVCIIIEVILFTAALIYQLIIIQFNKEEAYKCLTSLPKNVVSNLVENLRVLKKNDDGNDTSQSNDSEMSKQEDNIMKTFMTGGMSSTRIADRVMLIIGSLFTIAIEVAMIIIFFDLLPYESRRLLIAAPHLNYLTGSITEMMAANYVLSILSQRFANEPLQTKMYTNRELQIRFSDKLLNARNYYHSARFGGITIDDAPYRGFQEGLDYAYKLTDCKDPEAINSNFMDMISCYNVEGLFILCESILSKLIAKNNALNSFVLVPKNEYLDYVYTLTISPLYEGLFAPMFNKIIPTIEEELEIKERSVFTTLIILLVLVPLVEIFVFVQLANIEKHIKQTLRLLLHANTNSLLSTPKVVSILSGDFSRMKGDNTKRSAEFYDTLFQNMPDAVMIINNVTRQIESVNKSCCRLFFQNDEDLVGKNISEFFHSDKFSGNITKLLGSQCNTDSAPIQVKETNPEGQEVVLEMTTSVINNRQAFIIRDITNRMRYNKLISDERAKSDTLLDSILPRSLVKRVQAGEKNISFAVQSATIVFMDIVSFTPWCGSSEATKVMTTLNLLFKKFDAACSRYQTMTKIKCIGDCYMAAGGIFSEVNQPAEHAKEVVFFGLDALDCVTALDEELNENLQIRVGINTGGPIVAGVLGIGKPTFEILGPAINMAQQMEHHGVPMNVHISRPVYELIYGDIFKIKERGTIEVKNGKAVTYLVSGRRAC